jgi:hypothetical protein
MELLNIDIPFSFQGIIISSNSLESGSERKIKSTPLKVLIFINKNS